MSKKPLVFKTTMNVKNRKASYEYSFLKKYVAGIVLKGTEIKSIRTGSVSISEAYCLFVFDELWVRGMYIAPYELGYHENHEPRMDRKLLLTKRELLKLKAKTQDKGNTIIPIRLFFNKGLAKLEIALAVGKKMHDKRESIKQREMQRSMKQHTS